MAFRELRQLAVNMVTRAIVRVIDSSKKFQELQLEGVGGSVRADVEHVENYGFSSRPVAGAEAVVVNVEGDPGHPVAIAVGDRRYRILNLESGEVLVYDKTGSKILLKASGDIEITPSSGEFVLTGNATISGTLDVGGVLTGTTINGTEISDGGKILGTHTHPVGGATVSTTGTAAAQTGTVDSGQNSGAPN